MKNSKTSAANHLPKRWAYKDYSRAAAEAIAGALELSPVTAAVMAGRGVVTVEEAKDFLAPGIETLSNPFLLPDMEPAVERLRRAIERKEKILVYGDRDVDGVSSISIMVRTLRSLGAAPLWYIPSDEGYGVHRHIIDRYAAEGVTLIVTVDCGISAFEEADHAASLGIDLVITDHHEVQPEGLPRAVAVIDPKRSDSRYPFSELAGCSVALKAAEALMSSFGKYYNEEFAALAYLEGSGNKAAFSAVTVRNGIVTAVFKPSSEGALEKDMLGFIGQRRVIVYDRASLAPLAEGLPLLREIICDDERVLDLKDAEAPENACRPGGDAARLAEIFYVLENKRDLRMNFFRDSHLDVVTLGTIADIVPLLKENRVLVKHGLKNLALSNKAGVRVLMEKCISNAAPEGVSAKSISWTVTPLLNAAGRRGKADLAAELLLTDNAYDAYQLLTRITKLNVERRALQTENMGHFHTLLKEQCDLENDRLFVVTAKDVEHGVTGIVASQLARQYQRPVLLLIIEGNEAMGSGRSVPGFDLSAGLSACSDCLVKYGGHAQAAGLTVAVDKLDVFKQKLKDYAAREMTEAVLRPSLELDGDIEAADISMKLLKEISLMEPFGMGNPYPVFSVRNMKVIEKANVGANSDHLKLKISKNGGTALEAVGWGMGHLIGEISAYPFVDLAVQLEINVWNGRKSIQLLIQDIRPSVDGGN